jgi:hypothetical protein
VYRCVCLCGGVFMYIHSLCMSLTCMKLLRWAHKKLKFITLNILLRLINFFSMQNEKKNIKINFIHRCQVFLYREHFTFGKESFVNCVTLKIDFFQPFHPFVTNFGVVRQLRHALRRWGKEFVTQKLCFFGKFELSQILCPLPPLKVWRDMWTTPNNNKNCFKKILFAARRKHWKTFN